MVRQASTSSVNRPTSSVRSPEFGQSISPPRTGSPGVIAEYATKKKPPPLPPPLSRSVSPGPAEERHATATLLNVIERSTSESLPEGGPSSIPARRAHTVGAAPSLPTRKATLRKNGPDPSSIPPPVPESKTQAVHRDPLPGSPTTGTLPGPPRLPERPRGQSVGKADDARDKQATPRLRVKTATTAIAGTASTSPSSHSNSIPSVMSPQRSRELTNGFDPPPPPMRSAMAGSVSSSPRRESSKRHTASSEDEEEEDENGAPGIGSAAKRMLEDYPDSTHAYRRPPAFIPDVRINSMHHVYSFAIFGRYVCTGAHHVRVYDTQMSDRPIFVVDLKDVGLEFRMKDPRVTAMCFRPAVNPADEGRYLWCGTKDGHLWELDIKTGTVTETRSHAHTAPVKHIFRHKQWLLTLDDLGKLNVFEVGKAASGGSSSPLEKEKAELSRALRISEKCSFAKMIYGKLWTASAPTVRSTTNTSARGAIIRVFEPCAPDTMPPGKAISTTEWTGAVTSATMLPLRPDEVYLGHEGGFVSVWSADDLSCLQVLKISSTDILSLEGVGDKLWAGNRKGQIHVYGITQKPWRTTNTWLAHPELSIHSLILDPWSIEHAGRFILWSAARDTIRAWDGLLSVDWIDNQMTVRQADYCTFRDIKILVCSWNIDSAKPSDLSGSEPNALFFDELFSSVDSPHIIVFGFQEVIPLGDKKLTASMLTLLSDRAL